MTHTRGQAALAAGRVDVVFEACRESLEAVPVHALEEHRLGLWATALDPAVREAFVREFRAVGVTDPVFVLLAVQSDVEAGRVDGARALLEEARRLNPARADTWAQADAILAAPR